MFSRGYNKNYLVNCRRGLSKLESDRKGVTGLTGRYASALFELADESDVLDRVAEDLRFVVRLIEE
ncbi:MAG TPA: hypothetical protein EYM96_10725, partial [Rhodospirillales bacterium]|nr:hypothetical protein [Rhodospirillales bacterium]